MDKHYFIISDGNDNQRITKSRIEAKRALADDEFTTVTEVKEQTIYMENAMIRVSAHVELKE